MKINKGYRISTITQENIDDKPAIPDVLYRVFLQGYKMGLLGVDEIQSDAEFRAFKHKLGLEDEDN